MILFLKLMLTLTNKTMKASNLSQVQSTLRYLFVCAFQFAHIRGLGSLVRFAGDTHQYERLGLCLNYSSKVRFSIIFPLKFSYSLANIKFSFLEGGKDLIKSI